MNITFLLSRLDQTGMTTHTLDLTEALVRKGHEVTLIVGKNNPEDAVYKRLMDKFISTGANIDTFNTPARHSISSSALSAIQLIYKVLKQGGGNSCPISISIVGTLAFKKEVHLYTPCQ